MDIMTGLTAISKAIDIAKTFRDIENQLSDADFKYQISELYMSLSDAKIALADAQQAIADRDAEITQLKSVDSAKMRTVSYRSYNFGIDQNGKSIGRPFCPVCEQKEGLQVQITRGTSIHDLCPSCSGVYGRGGYPWKLPDDFAIPTDN